MSRPYLPSLRKHKRVSKLFLGKPYTRVHRVIDRPHGRSWKNPKQRYMLIFHHPLLAALIALLVSKDRYAWVAGLLHTLTDYVSKTSKMIKKLQLGLGEFFGRE